MILQSGVIFQSEPERRVSHPMSTMMLVEKIQRERQSLKGTKGAPICYDSKHGAVLRTAFVVDTAATQSNFPTLSWPNRRRHD